MAEPNLQKGSADPAVRDLQAALKALGYNPGPIDGVFGATTEAAVKAFQQAKGISADGVVGKVTWINIDEADQHAGEPSPALGVDGLVNGPCALGKMTAVRTRESAGNRDIPDPVVVVIAQRKRHQGFRPQPAPAPGLRRYLQTVDRRGFHRRGRVLRRLLRWRGFIGRHYQGCLGRCNHGIEP